MGETTDKEDGMGAVWVVEGGEGINPRSVYNELVKQAEWECGHDPYNGTISTSDGYVVHDWEFRTERSALDFAQQLGEQDECLYEKWGAFGAIPYWADDADPRDPVKGWVFFGLAAD